MDPDWNVEQYRRANGQTPYNSFVRALSIDARREAVALERMLKRAHVLKEPRSKALGQGLFELRGSASAFESSSCSGLGRRVVVLDGYLKKRQDIPAGVLGLVRRHKADLESIDETKKI